MTRYEVTLMNQQAETVRMRHEELDREIEAIRAERLLHASSEPRQGFAGRARSGIGRSLISLGTAIVGTADASVSTPSQRLGGRA
jgi:hypothetical protein